MVGKNRFSRLLKYLMSVAEVKNYTLSQQLQYDVSYISKWTSGQMLPSEKYEKKILRGISSCVVSECAENARDKLLADYQVKNGEELKMAIFDHLEAEYYYTKNSQENDSVNGELKINYFPEVTLSQYIAKMRHPVLRRVNSLEIVSALDIFAMNHEYRLQITQLENNRVEKGRGYPDVHYSMLVDIQKEHWDYIYDTIFLVYLLGKNCCVDFELYGGTQADGRAIFVVKEEYSISGMLLGRDHCISVVTSENPEICNTLYHNLTALCNREMLLFRRTTMQEMLTNNEYIHGMLSLKQSWIIGHLTEHFLPEDVFEEIVETLRKTKNGPIEPEQLRSVYHMTSRIIEESDIRILIYKTTFYNLIVERKVDFYNCKIQLSARQQKRCLEHFMDLVYNRSNVQVYMIEDKIITDLEYNDRHCLFLSEMVSYLRLDEAQNNLLLINRVDMREKFAKTFEVIWKSEEKGIVKNQEVIIANIQHVMQGIFTEKEVLTAEEKI